FGLVSHYLNPAKAGAPALRSWARDYASWPKVGLDPIAHYYTNLQDRGMGFPFGVENFYTSPLEGVRPPPNPQPRPEPAAPAPPFGSLPGLASLAEDGLNALFSGLN